MGTLVKLAVAAMLAVAAAPAYSSMPPAIFCWIPDHEFPVSCDDEGGDDDYAAKQTRKGRAQ